MAGHDYTRLADRPTFVSSDKALARLDVEAWLEGLPRRRYARVKGILSSGWMVQGVRAVAVSPTQARSLDLVYLSRSRVSSHDFSPPRACLVNICPSR